MSTTEPTATFHFELGPQPPAARGPGLPHLVIVRAPDLLLMLYGWIDGRQAAEWVNRVRHSRITSKLADDEEFCLPCHRPVKLLDPTRGERGKLIMLHGCCIDCGTSIHRGIRNDHSD